MKESYATALLEILGKTRSEEEVANILANVQELLIKRGHAKLYTAILRIVIQKLQKNELSKPVVKLLKATKEEFAKHQTEIMAYSENTFKETLTVENVTLREDSSIVGGFSIETTDLRVDQTYKCKLHKMYQRIIA